MTNLEWATIRCRWRLDTHILELGPTNIIQGIIALIYIYYVLDFLPWHSSIALTLDSVWSSGIPISGVFILDYTAEPMNTTHRLSNVYVSSEMTPGINITCPYIINPGRPTWDFINHKSTRLLRFPLDTSTSITSVESNSKRWVSSLTPIISCGRPRKRQFYKLTMTTHFEKNNLNRVSSHYP
jgi:hypothetical protein